MGGLGSRASGTPQSTRFVWAAADKPEARHDSTLQVCKKLLQREGYKLPVSAAGRTCNNRFTVQQRKVGLGHSGGFCISQLCRIPEIRWPDFNRGEFRSGSCLGTGREVFLRYTKHTLTSSKQGRVATQMARCQVT